MFYKYEIRNNGTEDILYLYLTMSYEFSKELGLQANDQEMSRRTKNFIRNNQISFHGKKVFLVIDGIVVKTLEIDEKKEIELLKENLYYSNEQYLVTVQLEDNALIEITLKEYLLGVLATNLFPHPLELEAIKSLAILYRTFAFSKMNEKNVIPSINDFCIYKPISYYKLAWIDHYDVIYRQLEKAIDETDCLFLTYQHSYILPFVHFSNCGQTFSHRSYPYLSSVRSLWDLASPYSIEIHDFSYSELNKIFHHPMSSHSIIQVLETDEKRFLQKVKIDQEIYSGKQLQELFRLKSLNANFILNRDFLRIITKGWGNSLGLSIFGANELAKNGCNCFSILNYYFPKVQLNKYVRELS